MVPEFAESARTDDTHRERERERERERRLRREKNDSLWRKKDFLLLSLGGGGRTAHTFSGKEIGVWFY